MPDVLVIGAGISGLTCAWQLGRAGLEVLMVEAEMRPGGVINSHKMEDYLLESGPNTILPTPEAMEIIEEAGLSDQIVKAPARAPRFIYVNGRLRRVPWVLSLGGTLRALAETLLPRRREETDESLASFFSRRFGPQVHERLAAPFVSGVYAGDSEKLSIEATFPRLRRLEQQYRSVILGMLRSPRPGPRPVLSSFRRGMRTLPEGLARGLEIRYGVRPARIETGWSVDCKTARFDAKALVLALPAYASSGLLGDLDSDLGELLASVSYAPMAVATVSVAETRLRAPLVGFGVLVPRTEGLHTLGTLFSSSLFPGRAPAGQTLLTSYLGGALEPEVLEWSDDRIWDTAKSDVERILGLRPGDARPLRLFRYKRAIPQYRLGHPVWYENVRERVGKLPGLFLAGNYLNGVSVPASMEQGRRVGDAVIEYLRRTS